VKLPYPHPPELFLYAEANESLELNPKKGLAFLDATKSVYLTCPSINDIANKLFTGRQWCSGIYYPQAGLRLSLSIPVASLKDWPSVKTSIQNLIKSWEAPIADQPTTH
jgi:hypothetical protein